MVVELLFVLDIDIDYYCYFELVLLMVHIFVVVAELMLVLKVTYYAYLVSYLQRTLVRDLQQELMNILIEK